jgi:hypothetical protein
MSDSLMPFVRTKKDNRSILISAAFAATIIFFDDFVASPRTNPAVLRLSGPA